MKIKARVLKSNYEKIGDTRTFVFEVSDSLIEDLNVTLSDIAARGVVDLSNEGSDNPIFYPPHRVLSLMVVKE